MPALLADAVHFVENAKAQYAAAQLGPVKPLTEDEMAAFQASFDRTRHADKLWTYFVSKGQEDGVLPDGLRFD